MGRLILIFACLSLAAMVLIDRQIGARAEFLNAWSVLERLIGREPSAGQSMVAARFGAAGELLAVLAANLAIGAILSGLVVLAGRITR